MPNDKLIDNRPIEDRVSEIIHAASAAIAHLNQSSQGEAQMATFFCVEIAVDVEDGVMTKRIIQSNVKDVPAFLEELRDQVEEDPNPLPDTHSLS